MGWIEKDIIKVSVMHGKVEDMNAQMSKHAWDSVVSLLGVMDRAGRRIFVADHLSV